MSEALKEHQDVHFSEQDDWTRPFSVLDRFLPPSMIQSRDDVHRGRLLVGMLLSYSAFLWIGTIYFAVSDSISNAIQFQALVALLPLNLLFLLLLILFRYTGAFLLCSNFCVAAAYIGITAGIYVSSGPVLSPASAVVPVTALLAFCLCGRAWGLFWAVIVLLTHSAMLYLLSTGFSYPDMLRGDKGNINAIVDWLIAYAAMITIVALYETMQARLKRERDAEHEKYVYMATHDQLTGLPNRVLFYDRLEGAMERARREKSGFALLYLDLDGFKPINDRFGHDIGDMVLQATARRLQSCLRDSDTVARMGGDEFAIILEHLGKQQYAIDVARKIGFRVSQSIAVPEQDVRVKTSIGIAFFPEDGRHIDELIGHADVAMYQAKKSPEICTTYDAVIGAGN